MELIGVKNVTINDQMAKMTFCKTCKTCPSIEISVDSDDVLLGGEHEGYSTWTKESFTDFVNIAKQGVYDKYLLEDDNQDTKGEEA